MMLKLIISPQAREDLFDIWFYIAEDSTINADRFTAKIVKKYEWLTENSEAGVKCDDLLPGLRSFPYAKYMLYYRVKNNTLELVRILHGSRDLGLVFH